MSATELCYLSLAEAARRIRERSLSPVELTQAVLERIAKIDDRVKAFITLLEEEALAAARSAEQDIARGNYLGPLHGIPVAIKDIYDTAGVTTAAGSKVRRGRVPAHDSTVVRRMREAGSIILGKVTTHEFAFGFDSPPTRNPWNLDYTPSGSSGGSGAALSAGLCFGATGSDTGGSIRAPAAVDGIAGIKPTYGRVSKAGVAVLSWSLDHAGPMARAAHDLALLLQVIAGHDPLDPTTRKVPVPDYAAALTGDLKGLRIGVPKNYFFDDVQEPVGSAMMSAIDVLRGLGATIVDVRIPDFDNVLPTFFSIVIPEAATYHQHTFRERAAEYGEDVRQLLETGQLYLATTYISAQQNRSALRGSLRTAMEGIDALVTPTMPVTAPKVGQEEYRWGHRSEHVFEASARFCCPFNLAGLPAASVPCGFSPDNMPIGLQIVGRPFDETAVLKIADAFERATEWHTRRPPL